nr:hypothetical protein Itr_chr09CG17100 [Ipomoea trifida]
MFSWGNNIACCEKSVELFDYNYLGCANDEAVHVDMFDYVDSGVMKDVDSCVNDVVSCAYNCDDFCDLNGEVEEKVDGLKRVTLMVENMKEKQEEGIEESGDKSLEVLDVNGCTTGSLNGLKQQIILGNNLQLLH